MDISQPKYYYASVLKMFGYVMLSLFFVGIGVLILLPTDSSKQEIGQIVAGIVCILFFGVGVAIFTWRLLNVLRRKPILTITNTGVLDKTNLLSGGKQVTWDELTNARIIDMQTRTYHTSNKQRFLALELKDPQSFVQRLNTFQRYVFKLNTRMMRGNYLYTGLSFVRAKPEDILQAILAYSRGQIGQAAVQQETISVRANLSDIPVILATGEAPGANYSNPSKQTNNSGTTQERL